jgi:hypothetical protein
MTSIAKRWETIGVHELYLELRVPDSWTQGEPCSSYFLSFGVGYKSSRQISGNTGDCFTAANTYFNAKTIVVKQ